MSFPEEDDWLGGYGLDDYNKCASPLGADTSLSLAGVSVREPSPVSPSRDLGGIPFGDNSLSVPMRDFSFGNEPPRLSPESSYQSMAPLQSTSYDPSAVHTQIDTSYNSFEQPSIIVNGHYARPLDQPIPQQQFFQQQPDPPPPPLATMSLHHHQSQASGSVMQQMLNTPPVRQTSTPQQQQPPSRQRLIQPKTQNNGRKRTSGAANNNTVGAVLTKANRIAASTSSDMQSQGGSRNTTEVRICGEDLIRVSQITSEITQLQDQQAKFGIDNKGRIVELESERANIFLKALTSQHVGETVLNQVAQVAAAARQSPQPRSNVNRSRSHHARTSSQFDVAPDSPQYQPQMYLSQYPTTSTAQFHDYSSNHTQPQVIHQQAQPTHAQPNQRQVYRAGSVVYQNSSQVPQGAVYVQSVPPPAQAQYSQPTVGQVVRQQHQLRHVSGGQQLLVQQHVLVPPGPARTHLMQQQQQLVPSQVIIPSSQSQTQVLLVQHLSSAQCKKRLEEKRGLRQHRIREYFNKLHSSLNHPNTEVPFTNLNDVLQRLLPYHSYGEPSIKEEQLEQFDMNYMKTTINLGEQRKRLEKRIRKVFYDEALKSNEDEERNLLLYLDGEYERQKLEEEKANINADTLAAFVESSPIISALRSSDSSFVDRLKSEHLSKCDQKLRTITQQYEYHAFSEVPRPTSPFKSPSPWKSPASSIRSPSPIKSPCSVHSPRLRGRPSASYAQCTPVKETVRIRQTSKPRSITDLKPIMEKNEVSKLELFKPASTQVTKDFTNHSRITLGKNEESSPTPLSVSCSSLASTSKTMHSLSSPTYSAVTFGRLPAKKELLSRARKGVPPALRSPPAQSTLIPNLSHVPQQVEEYEGSDGSASPELGLDDADNICPPTLATSIISTLDTIKTTLIEVNADSDGLVRKLSSELVADAKDGIERFNVNDRDQPVERIRFKPQVPRPTPMSPVDIPFSSHEKVNIKDIDQEVIKSSSNHITGNNSVEKICAPARPPPIKLKLKLGGDSKELYVENNENSLREEGFRKKHKKHKKKKRKREREHSRRHNSDEHRDIVLVPTEGPRIKIKIGLNNSLSHTNTSVPSSKADHILKYSTVPSTINSTEYREKDEIRSPPMKVPRLKIRLGADPTAVPISVMQQNGPAIKTRQLSDISVDPLGIEFSDDSDSEAERLRSATDKALRGLPSFVGISSLPKPTNTPLLPWSTHPAP